jgi:hypothetical protein
MLTQISVYSTLILWVLFMVSPQGGLPRQRQKLLVQVLRSDTRLRIARRRSTREPFGYATPSSGVVTFAADRLDRFPDTVVVDSILTASSKLSLSKVFDAMRSDAKRQKALHEETSPAVTLQLQGPLTCCR